MEKYKFRSLKEDSNDEELSKNLDYVYRYLMRAAKMDYGVPVNRAEILVDSVLNLFSALADSKFNMTVENMLNKALKILYSRIARP